MLAGMLSERVAGITAAVASAARRAGRPPGDVTLVAVTKSAPASVFEQAAAAGLTDLGENRLPAALERMAGWETRFRWHFVGHLQANKVRRAVAAFDVFHGVDSLELLLRIDRVAAELGRRPECLLQIDITGEASKHGLAPEEAGSALAAGAELEAATLVGLMTMAPVVADPEEARPVFADLARLRRELAEGASRPLLPHLSMGMSQDFEVAVEEGATLIRIGRQLMDGLD